MANFAVTAVRRSGTSVTTIVSAGTAQAARQQIVGAFQNPFLWIACVAVVTILQAVTDSLPALPMDALLVTNPAAPVAFSPEPPTLIQPLFNAATSVF